MKTNLFIKFFLLVSVFQVCEFESQNQSTDSKNVFFYLNPGTFAISYNLQTKQASIVKNSLIIEPGAVMKSHSSPSQVLRWPTLSNTISTIISANEHVYIFPLTLGVKEFFYNLTQENELSELKSSLIECDGQFEAVVEKMTDLFMECVSYSELAEIYCSVCAQNYLEKSSFCLALGTRIETFLRVNLLSYKDIFQMHPLWDSQSLSTHEKAVEFIKNLEKCGSVWPAHEIEQFSPTFNMARDIIAKYWAEESKKFFNSHFSNKTERKKAAEELKSKVSIISYDLEYKCSKGLQFIFVKDINILLATVIKPLNSKLFDVVYGLEPVENFALYGIGSIVAVLMIAGMVAIDNMLSRQRR